MSPDMVAEMVEVWRAKNVSLVTANAEYIDAQSKLLGRTARDPNISADDSFETLARDGANACCFGASIGFEREVYETFGMPPAHLDNIDIMLPFYAYLLRGAYFLPKPLLRYRVHGQNTSLSLTAERSDELGRLRTHERIFYSHIAHAVVMLEEIARLNGEDASAVQRGGAENHSVAKHPNCGDGQEACQEPGGVAEVGAYFDGWRSPPNQMKNNVQGMPSLG